MSLPAGEVKTKLYINFGENSALPGCLCGMLALKGKWKNVRRIRSLVVGMLGGKIRNPQNCQKKVCFLVIFGQCWVPAELDLYLQCSFQNCLMSRPLTALLQETRSCLCACFPPQLWLRSWRAWWLVVPNVVSSSEGGTTKSQ